MHKSGVLALLFVLLCNASLHAQKFPVNTFIDDFSFFDGFDIDRLDESFSLEVFPVPAHQRLNIQIHSEAEGHVRLSIWDLTGRKVEQILYEKQDLTFQEQVNLGHLPSGMYVLEVELAHHHIAKRFMIE